MATIDCVNVNSKYFSTNKIFSASIVRYRSSVKFVVHLIQFDISPEKTRCLIWCDNDMPLLLVFSRNMTKYKVFAGKIITHFQETTTSMIFSNVNRVKASTTAAIRANNLIIFLLFKNVHMTSNQYYLFEILFPHSSTSYHRNQVLCLQNISSCLLFTSDFFFREYAVST